MKKMVSLLLVLIAFSSCQEDVKFNNPGFQAYRDGILFRGIDVKAYKSTSGAISLVALAQDEELEIDVANSIIGTYYFGTTSQATSASYASSFNDLELLYETTTIDGPVAKMSTTMTVGGTGYVSDCILVDVANNLYSCNNSHATTGGSGSGLTLGVIANTSGVVTGVRVSSPGNGYLPGDLITITGGGNNAKVKVLNIEGSNGEIVITENTGSTISGNFKFNAVKTNSNPLGNDLVNFQYGTFYKLPILPAL
jgi:hypothetical protein